MKKIESFLNDGIILTQRCVNELIPLPFRNKYLFDKPVPGMFIYTIFDISTFNTFMISADNEKDNKLIFSNSDVTISFDISDNKKHVIRGIGNYKVISSIEDFIKFMKEKIEEEKI